MANSTRTVKVSSNTEMSAWKWMRYSGLLLIPLAWGHVLIQDVLVGVHRIDINYVARRWALMGWRFYDFFLLGLALAHGFNGLRQILLDFSKEERTIWAINWSLFILWLLVTLIGTIALIRGVRGT